MDITEIQKEFAGKNYRYTRHGTEQRIKRNITEKEIEDAVRSGEIIERYPSDKYGPSCLIFGRTEAGKPLHVQVAFFPMFSIVTVYEPDPGKWIDFKIRRR